MPAKKGFGDFLSLCRCKGKDYDPTCKSAEHLVALGIAREITGKKRGKLFVYRAYLSILDEGTEPL